MNKSNLEQRAVIFAFYDFDQEDIQLAKQAACLRNNHPSSKFIHYDKNRLEATYICPTCGEYRIKMTHEEISKLESID